MKSAENCHVKDEHVVWMDPNIQEEVRKVKLLLQETGRYQPFILDDRLPFSNENSASSVQQDITSMQNSKKAISTKNNEHEMIMTDCSYGKKDINNSQYRSSSFASNISSPNSSHSTLQSVPRGGGSDTGVQKMKRSDTSDTYATSIGSSNSGTRVKLVKMDDINVYADDKCNKFCLSQFYFYFVSVLFLAVCAFLFLTCYMLGNHIMHKG